MPDIAIRGVINRPFIESFEKLILPRLIEPSGSGN